MEHVLAVKCTLVQLLHYLDPLNWVALGLLLRKERYGEEEGERKRKEGRERWKGKEGGKREKGEGKEKGRWRRRKEENEKDVGSQGEGV